MNSEKQYIDLYRQCRSMINDHSSAVMNAVRDEAFERFKTIEFPTRKVEHYKYTNLQEVFAPDLGLNLNRLNIPVNPYNVFRCEVPNLSTQLYFMVNDVFYDKVLPKVELPDGVIVDSLRKISERQPELVAKYYNTLLSSKDGGEEALNTMFAQDGLFIYVPKNVKVNTAIQVINIMRSDIDLMVNRRVLIVVEDGAEVRLLFCDHAIDNHNFLSTQVVEAFVGENATLDIYNIEETHVKNTLVSTTYIDQKANSRVNHSALTLHNGLTRNTVNLVFRGEGAECNCNGCAIADKEQHVDNNVVIDHATAHCESKVLYKYVLDEKAVGAFAGRVLVRKDAQKTTSAMTNQNLCAVKTAHMYTQPMLEIYADDVKCSHGSTVGQLNDAALFYMRQRGISLSEARLLLEFAFVGEVVDNIKLQPLRDRLHYLVEKRFRGELNKCEGCRQCR